MKNTARALTISCCIVGGLFVICVALFLSGAMDMLPRTEGQIEPALFVLFAMIFFGCVSLILGGAALILRSGLMTGRGRRKK